MKASLHALFVLTLSFHTTLSAATSSWTGGGGDNSWHNPANWAGSVLPGQNDDVVINGTGEVVFSSGTTTVRSLQSTRNFTLAGGILTLAAGASWVQGTLSLKSGSFYV